MGGRTAADRGDDGATGRPDAACRPGDGGTEVRPLLGRHVSGHAATGVHSGGTAGHARRFDAAHLWLYDRDEDGFIEWSEAVEYMNGAVMESYEEFRDHVRAGELLVQASPGDVQLLLSQVSQDPQVFGPLAVRAGRPAAADPPSPGPAPARRPRFGAFLEDRVGRGGAYVEVTGVEPNSPATRVRSKSWTAATLPNRRPSPVRTSLLTWPSAAA